MKIQSVQDLLRMALSKEQSAIQFYHDMACLMKNPSTKSLFEVLVEQEFAHARQLELELEKLGFTVNETPEPPLRDAGEQELTARIIADQEAEQMTFLDGLVLAIEKERASFQLYVELLGQAQDPELRNVLMVLAEEEMRHVLQFEHEYEGLTHHRKD